MKLKNKVYIKKYKKNKIKKKVYKSQLITDGGMSLAQSFKPVVLLNPVIIFRNFFLVLDFWGMASCSPGWPKTLSVAEADLEPSCFLRFPSAGTTVVYHRSQGLFF